MVKKRNYAQEYAKFQASPEQIHQRSERNQARAAVEKKIGHKLPKTQEIDHKKPLAKGGSNNASNLQILSRTANRRKGKK